MTVYVFVFCGNIIATRPMVGGIKQYRDLSVCPMAQLPRLQALWLPAA